tara:strand:+ start:368 stop:628 length:261 start_codon:yes stop_codon:yes gene_type:complete
METYYLLLIDNYKFIISKENSSLQVTQQNEGQISNIVAIFKGQNNFKYWEKMENFNEKITEIIYKNKAFTEGSYANKINNFLNNTK